MVGDSITAWGWHTANIMLFYATRFPEMKLNFHNLGISGDSCAGIMHRMNYDILPHLDRHNCVCVLMIGMNDVGRNKFSQNAKRRTGEREFLKSITQTRKLYAERVESISNTLSKNSRILVLFTPSIYDQTANLAAENLAGVNDELRQFGEICKSYSAKLENCRVADMNLGMSEVNAKLQKDFGAEQTIIGPDRVHPSFCGGFVMLNRWLKDLESDSIPVSSVALDARNKRIASLVNCKVSEVEFSEDAIKFVSEEFSLPFPVDESAQKVLAYLPFQTKYNRQTLQIIGLNPGTYILSIGGNPVAEYSAKDLARGVNLSENRKTPQYAQAEAIYEKCSAFRNLAASFRSIAMVELLERKEFGKISDPMERIEYARSKLADKTAPYPDIYEYYVKNKAREKEIAKELSRLNEEIYASAIPAPHLYELRKK